MLELTVALLPPPVRDVRVPVRWTVRWGIRFSCHCSDLNFFFLARQIRFRPAIFLHALSPSRDQRGSVSSRFTISPSHISMPRSYVARLRGIGVEFPGNTFIATTFITYSNAVR